LWEWLSLLLGRCDIYHKKSLGTGLELGLEDPWLRSGLSHWVQEFLPPGPPLLLFVFIPACHLSPLSLVTVLLLLVLGIALCSATVSRKRLSAE
jgi:hypothetical protein